MSRAFAAGLLAAVTLGLGACSTLMERTEAPPEPPPPPYVPDSPPKATVEAPEPKVVTKPVKVSCVPRNLPKAPRYPDSDKALKAAGGAADRYQLLAAGRLLRERRLALLERIIAGCR